MSVALITGITGQDGSYLAELLLKKNYKVIGMVRRTSTVTFERIAHIQDDIIIEQGDLHDQSSLVDVLERYEPTEIYNLAAQSFVPTSWNQPVLTGEVTALGHAPAGSDSPGGAAGAFLPGFLLRDVWQSARSTTERRNSLLPPQPLRRGQGVRSLHHRQLP